MHFLHGRADCTEAPILGTLFFEAITSSKTRSLVAGVEHRTIGSDAGAADIRTTFLERCR